jgi:hypothetical protein
VPEGILEVWSVVGVVHPVCVACPARGRQAEKFIPEQRDWF